MGFVALLFLFLGVDAHAWSETGHRVVGELAERHIAPRTTRQVRRLLDGPLMEAATWPDDMRNYAGWECLTPFHYVTVPPSTAWQRDNAAKQGDALHAIAVYARDLANPKTSDDRKRLALRMMAHVVGDLHQPLHVGRGCDRGATRVTVDYFGEPQSLHGVWDGTVIEQDHFSYTEWSDLLAPRIDGLADRAKAAPDAWLDEAQVLLDDVYRAKVGKRADTTSCYCGDCDDGFTTFGGCVEQTCALHVGDRVTLRYPYQTKARVIIRDQLALAGARLAWILDETLGRGRMPSTWNAFESRVGAPSDAVVECNGPAKDL